MPRRMDIATAGDWTLKQQLHYVETGKRPLMSNDDDVSDGAAALIGGAFAIAVIAALLIWRGFVLSVMWSWFLVPFGLPAIQIAHAIGIAAIAGMMTSRGSSSSKKGWVEILFTPFITTAMIFAVAAIAHSFM
jgi:hypothetical protein